MKLSINGQEHEFDHDINVRELVRHLGLDGQFVAVERNRLVVSHRRFDETTLQDGDVLEVVTLVGGG